MPNLIIKTHQKNATYKGNKIYILNKGMNSGKPQNEPFTNSFVINPAKSSTKKIVMLNNNIDNKALDFELAKSVGLYFRLNEEQMKKIIQEVLQVTKNWRIVAMEFGFVEANKN
jgi:hypothetical protein